MSPSSPRVIGQKFAALRGRSVRGTIRAATGSAILARWWRGSLNWGDALSPVLTSWISGREVYGYQEVVNLAGRPVFSVVGSILDSSSIDHHVVWGAGFMHRDGAFRIAPREIRAIRGPLSRQIVRDSGLPCPAVFGDPALLLPAYYRPFTEPTWDVGIVPHMADRAHPWIDSVRRESGVRVLDVQGGDITGFIDQVLSCRMIASSSLHGVILADAYGIPAVWIELSDRVLGDRFKFWDYLESVGRGHPAPVEVTSNTTLGEVRDGVFLSPIDIDLDALVTACPFSPD